MALPSFCTESDFRLEWKARRLGDVRASVYLLGDETRWMFASCSSVSLDSHTLRVRYNFVSWGVTDATGGWRSGKPEWTYVLCASPPFICVLHCPIGMYLQNTSSKIKLFKHFKTSGSGVLHHARALLRVGMCWEELCHCTGIQLINLAMAMGQRMLSDLPDNQRQMAPNRAHF